MQFSARALSISGSLCLLLTCPVLLQADTPSPPAAITADGGRYYGPLVDGRRQGYGRIEWPNGARYEGGFVSGLYSGRGRLQSASGMKYEGDFANGMMAGQGRMETRDGTIYVGAFHDDEFNGHGSLKMPNGDVYEGAFEHGHFHGKGKLIAADGTYDGEFRQGQYWGHGELTYRDGRKYVGAFVRGEYQGKGRYETAEGDVYEGEFDKSELTGEGNYVLKDGSRYQGSFLKWQPHGKGIYTDAKSNVYEGRFTDGVLSDTGRMTAKDGSRYEGGFRQWQFHGQGVYRYANGNEYKGGFAHGLYDGAGTLSYAAPKRDGRTRDAGNWRYGELENKAQEQQTRTNVEAALYNQRALLDQTLAGLATHDPKRIDMYLLAVGGDGSQEVFRREVQFVREQFDREFGTRDRSIALINSRNSVTSVPMATLTSIRESLKGMAARMDREQDILFVFLTSHGSKDHVFTLAQNGMEMRGLHARELGSMLKETGIRWKVVLVSACYSGGFIDAIKDEYTLVITAARHDRSSFGCADDNDFTYFGRAFFKDSLSGSRSFQDAFQNAKILVEQWEKKDARGEGGAAGEKAIVHSLPQMHDPQAIRAHLQRWHAQRHKSAKSAVSAAAIPEQGK
jgi:hypothetical protein